MNRPLELILAPTIRGALFDGTAAPRVSFRAEQDAEMLIELPGTPESASGPSLDSVRSSVTDALRPLVDAGRIPESVAVAGVGAFDILSRRTAGDAADPGLVGLRAVRERIAIITGGAQGFGAEIAKGLVAAGAFVVIADLNIDAAAAFVAELNQKAGDVVALAVGVDVSDEQSVTAMIETVVEAWGGVDIFVSNAGVLKAGSVFELSLKDFAFVTDVNYTGFFLCTKHAAPVMALQNAAAATHGLEYYTDIIQINSKSGLAGSNRNGAYSGAKFGGIGLVQSFALELVEDRIKVNAICPGNFFDGPLWSDPDRGLFVQYLNAGKVPGATSIADVKRFYEEKVPMKRGCSGADVVTAIFYAVAQKYETGQAIPVTGGQNMIH